MRSTWVHELCKLPSHFGRHCCLWRVNNSNFLRQERNGTSGRSVSLKARGSPGPPTGGTQFTVGCSSCGGTVAYYSSTLFFLQLISRKHRIDLALFCNFKKCKRKKKDCLKCNRNVSSVTLCLLEIISSSLASSHQQKNLIWVPNFCMPKSLLIPLGNPFRLLVPVVVPHDKE